MPFLTDDVSCVIRPDGRYVLTGPLTYRGARDTFTVPAGFTTDLASVPRPFTWLVPVAGIHNRAAIVHDFLCADLRRNWRDGRRGAGEWVTPYASAVDTDGIFRRILGELGVPLVRRWLYWAGVRWGALIDPWRRAGWWSTAWPLVPITVAAAPVLLPVTIGVLAVLAVDRALEQIP